MNVYVRSDGAHLHELTELYAHGRLSMDVAREYPLTQADPALADVTSAGLSGAAVLIL